MRKLYGKIKIRGILALVLCVMLLVGSIPVQALEGNPENTENSIVDNLSEYLDDESNDVDPNPTGDPVEDPGSENKDVGQNDEPEATCPQ